MNTNCPSLCGLVLLLATAPVWLNGDEGRVPPADKEAEALAVGKELFTREWLHGDKRSFAGDGLGPVFNARSCVSCHHQAGVGGAGTRESNVTLVSVFVTVRQMGGAITGLGLHSSNVAASSLKQPNRQKLIELHPDLGTESSFPLHRFGSHRKFEKWKRSLFSDDAPEPELEKHPNVLAAHANLALNRSLASDIRGEEMTKEIDRVTLALIPSQRNTPPLFGAGLIDRIPDFVLEQVASEQARAAKARPPKQAASEDDNARAATFRNGVFEDELPLPVKGRVSRLKDGRVGRFGWKANVATLKEFTLQACSSELGLEVPGFHRAAPPWKKKYKAPGLDLSAQQCEQLVGFVAAISRPGRRSAETPQHAAEIASGQKLFSSVGCAECHRPKLGDVDGIYSDLLLHDMGQLISDSGSYRTHDSIPDVAATDNPLPVKLPGESKEAEEPAPKFGALTREWRTPPLWGLRDSPPYLHDGRADTIADAVALHGGEGMRAAVAFFKLTSGERQQIELFLQSLAAPATSN